MRLPQREREGEREREKQNDRERERESEREAEPFFDRGKSMPRGPLSSFFVFFITLKPRVE